MIKGTKTKRSDRAADIDALCEAARDFGEARAPELVAHTGRRLLALLSEAEPLVHQLEQVVRDADGELRRRVLSIESELRSACESRKWSLDGVWPQFFIEKAIEVMIDEASATARVGPERAPLDAAVIVEVAAPLVRQLLPRSFSAGDFLASIARAVDAVGNPGAGAPIGQVYRQLVIDSQPTRLWRDARPELFVSLTLEQLRARLSHTLASDARLTDGRVLRISPPIDSKDGIFIWQPAEHRFAFVGRLQFVQEAQL